MYGHLDNKYLWILFIGEYEEKQITNTVKEVYK